jgi:Uma2 family endonuclease
MATATVEPPVVPPPPGEDALYEVVNGQRVEIPPMGAYQGEIASALCGFLRPFATTRRLGKVVVEVLFDFGRAEMPQRRPDLAFVSYERWPRGRQVPETNAWDVVPDLAVEVVSPTNLAEEIVQKVNEYFAAGVRQVWVIYANVRQVYVYDTPTSIRVVAHGGELDGGAILPGFRLAPASLFEDDAGPD